MSNQEYAAGFLSKRAKIVAKDLAQAKELAVEKFKPNKSERGLVWVVLSNGPIKSGSL